MLLVAPALEGLQPGQLYERLAERLPRHMRPAYIRIVDVFPKTPTGKIHKVALGKLADKEGAWVSPSAAERHT